MLHVKKFGGTSVGSIEKIQSVAERVLRDWQAGAPSVVVVSAMAGDTDGLLELARGVAKQPSARELDVLLATGEQKTVALLAMCLQERGCRAETFYGHRVGLRTDASHNKATILATDTDAIREAIDAGVVPVVAGFQGIAPGGAITTLGRGGSDTTAVAYAAALGVPCRIYTDVPGIFTADPRAVTEARLLPRISYDEIIELSSSGAKVMETRSVILAKRFGVPLVICPAHEPGEGTHVTEFVNTDAAVTSITASLKEVRFTIAGLPRQIGVQADLFEELAERNILVDMYIQNGSRDERMSFSFTCHENDFYEVATLARSFASERGGRLLDPEFSLAKISAIGSGMNDRPGVAAQFFEGLSGRGINMNMIACADLKISVLVPKDQAEEALRVLHHTFELANVPISEQV